MARFNVAMGVLGIVLAAAPGSAAEFTVLSPDERINATVTHDQASGKLTYRVSSGGQQVIAPSDIGLHTDRADFRLGATLAGDSRSLIDETYRLPQGKVSTYRNHANELSLHLRKAEQDLHVRFRVYNDGIAFSFQMPGNGEVTFLGESSSVHLEGERLAYWGQAHPNSYGYETRLGPVTADQISIPVLAHLQDSDHYIFIAQAATYGHYIQPHFQRDGAVFRFSYPLDQERLGPVRSSLPWQSPWRMILISPRTPAKIVESYLIENLNPPTDPRLLDDQGDVMSWIKPGRVMWDFIAGDRDKPRQWVDGVAAMGWEYYLADAGFADRFGGEEGVREAVGYAADRKVGIIGWAHTRDHDTPEKSAQNMRRYAEWGLKGAKIDFFDHNTLDEKPREWRDYEDTQPSLQMRDWLFDLGIRNKFLLEFHGNTLPTGERRRYPHLMTLEGVNGMEKREPAVSNDLTIPFVRNVMGPVSYTVIRFRKSPGSHAYQLAMPIVYEAGLMIYAEHHEALAEWPGRELIKDIPAAWDQIRFIDGMPGSHVIIARRRGDDWFIGGMTASPRTARVRLDFRPPDRAYEALIFRDDTHTTMHREVARMSADDELLLPMHENGGFAVRLTPVTAPGR